MQITAITTTHVLTVDGKRWTRDDKGNVFIYNSADDPVAEVDCEDFEAIATGDVDVTDRPVPDVDEIARAASKRLRTELPTE